MRGGERMALVVGAGGGIGGAAARALAERGWSVRGLSRSPRPPERGIRWFEGDALKATDVEAAASDCSLIVHAANPAKYLHWNRVVLPMIDNVILAARPNRSRIVLPGTIYNYGPDAFPLIREDAPQHPVSRKGRLRVEMERRLENAAAAGIPVLIVRSGNFFGSGAGNGWFHQGLVRPGRVPQRIWDPARGGTTHAWAYLPDVGRTIALLAEHSGLESFERVGFSGYQVTTAAIAAAIADAIGADEIRVLPFPWTAVAALSPVVRLFREMKEMRYLWQQTIALSDKRLRDLLGPRVPLTPLPAAVRETLQGLGCLPARASLANRI